MIRDALRLDRRSLLTAAGGVGVGMFAVGGLAAADGIVRTPTLTIIGEDEAQFALLRTRGVKVGLLFGPPTEVLLAAIAPLLGWTAPALDVLAISPAALTETAGAWLAATSHVRSLLVLGPVGPSQMPALKPGVQARALNAPATTSLSHDVVVSFLPAFPVAAYGAEDNVGAMVAIQRGSQSILMLDDPQALTRQPWSDVPALLVIPTGDLRPIVATARFQALAVNSSGKLTERLVSDDLALPTGQLAVLRTFVTEPATVMIEHEHLRLPRWARLLTPAATP